MRVRTIPTFGVERAALVLLVSLLPMLTFFGHWPAITVTLPGTAVALQLPFSGPPPGPAAGHSHVGGDAHAHAPGDHEAHCHASMASCAQTQVGGQAPVTVLLETVTLLLGAGTWLAMAARAERAHREADLRSIDPPPRIALLQTLP